MIETGRRTPNVSHILVIPIFLPINPVRRFSVVNEGVGVGPDPSDMGKMGGGISVLRKGSFRVAPADR